MIGPVVLQTLAPAAQLGPFGYLAGAAFLVGFVWETVADLQKFHFKNKNPDKYAPYPCLACMDTCLPSQPQCWENCF